MSAAPETIQADVCIVGAGPAGLMIASELAGSGLQVALVDCGGFNEEEADGCSYTVVAEHSSLRLGEDLLKPRFFGGNSNYWYGNCRPLEEPDFAEREWVPHSGWPLTRNELLPYYERAEAALGNGDFALYDLEAGRPLLSRPSLAVDRDVLETRLFHTTPVLELGLRQRPLLEAAENIALITRARAARFEVAGSGEAVSALRLIERDGTEKLVEAGQFVLACGGVENARLLLASQANGNGGLGNHNDVVGRFFMDHWFFDFGLGDWNRPDIDLYEGQLDKNDRPGETVRDTSIWAQIALAETTMQRESLPGQTIWFVRKPPDTLSVFATRNLLEAVRQRSAVDQPRRQLELALSDPLAVARHVRRTVRHRGKPVEKGLTLRLQLEQLPHPDNRISLSASRRDAFGLPEAELSLALRGDEASDHLRALPADRDELGLDGQDARPPDGDHAPRRLVRVLLASHGFDADERRPRSGRRRPGVPRSRRQQPLRRWLLGLPDRRNRWSRP